MLEVIFSAILEETDSTFGIILPGLVSLTTYTFYKSATNLSTKNALDLCERKRISVYSYYSCLTQSKCVLERYRSYFLK